LRVSGGVDGFVAQSGDAEVSKQEFLRGFVFNMHFAAPQLNDLRLKKSAAGTFDVSPGRKSGVQCDPIQGVPQGRVK
jgi:hypothetical protein